MHPGAVVRVTKCAKKAMKVAKIFLKKSSQGRKKAGRKAFWMDPRSSGGKLLQNGRHGGGSGSGKANMKMADEGGLGVSVAQIGRLGSFFDAPDELHFKTFYQNMCLCIF
jgi:hypothetical protein